MDPVELLVALLLPALLEMLRTVLKSRLQKGKPQRLEDELENSFQQLREKSAKTIELLNRIEREIRDRRRALSSAEDELSQMKKEKTLFELTDTQKEALQSLVRRQPTARDIFTSKDFWLGRVLVSTVFFGLGLAAGKWFR